MKVIAHTGLVPVKALRRFRNRPAGAVFGVEPAIAVQAIKDGDVELFPIRSDMETSEYQGVAPTTAVPTETGEPEHAVVEIPDDWRTAHGTKRSLIAKAILGIDMKEKLPAPDGVEVGAYAIQVIEAELAKRADAEATVEPTTTSEATTTETSATEPSA